MIRKTIVAAVVLLASGCAGPRVWLDELAALAGRERPPETVSGLDFRSMREIGALREECQRLGEHREQGNRVRRDLLEQRLIPGCRRIIRTEQERIREEQAAAAQAARERERRQREQRERERREQRREAAAEQAEREQQAAELAERESNRLREQRLEEAAVHAALSGVPSRPLAHFTGQPGEAPLGRFLACMELSYPNAGYEVDHPGRELEVVIREVEMPRGNVPVEMRFRRQGEYWLMVHLQVADIEARTAEDRFILSQNLVVEGCPGEDGLFGH